MTNDDPGYVRSLERALEAVELEIKGLENDLRERDLTVAEMQEQLAPTRMGEPTIEQDLSKCPQCGGEADNGHDRCVPPSAYLCGKCTELHND